MVTRRVVRGGERWGDGGMAGLPAHVTQTTMSLSSLCCHRWQRGCMGEKRGSPGGGSGGGEWGGEMVGWRAYLLACPKRQWCRCRHVAVVDNGGIWGGGWRSRGWFGAPSQPISQIMPQNKIWGIPSSCIVYFSDNLELLILNIGSGNM